MLASNTTHISGLAPSSAIAFQSTSSSPFRVAYAWNNTTGAYGSKYANPSTGDNGGNVFWHPSGDVVFYCSAGTGLAAYPFDYATGWGTKYTDPGGSPGSATRGGINGDGTVVGVATAGTDRFYAWPWNNTTGFGTKYTGPSSKPIGQGTSLVFNRAGTIALCGAVEGAGTSDSPWIYSFSVSTGWGSLGSFASGTNRLRGQSFAIFSPDENYVLAASGVTPFYRIWPLSGLNVGSGTSVLASYSTVSPGFSAMAFSPTGGALLASEQNSPYIHAWAWSGGATGSKYSNPSTLPTSQSNQISFSADGRFVAVGQSPSPYQNVYQCSDSTGFGTRVSDPSGLFGNMVYGVAFSPN